MPILKQLQKFGFTEVQAKIYLAVLEHKKTTILQLSRQTGIQRPTIYDNISFLEENFLVSKVVEKGRTFIAPNEPKALFHIVSQKQNQAREILPDLNEIFLQGTPSRPTVKFFHGEEGLRKLAEVILQSKSKVIRTLADYEENIQNAFSEKFLSQFWQARTRRGVKAHVLYTNRSKNLLAGSKAWGETGNIRYNREMRLLPKEIDFQVLYTIVDDNVLFWSSKEEDFSFQFVSSSYADSLISLFDYLWGLSDIWSGK